MKPMLAKKFKDHQHKLRYPCFVQPKLNGVRAIYACGLFQSRDQHLWRETCLLQLRQDLRNLPLHFVLDGELYCHGMPLQNINSAVGVNRKTDSGVTPKVEYHVFDCLISGREDWNFEQRFAELQKEEHLLGKNISLVPTHKINEATQGEELFAYYKKQDYEGLIYRQNRPYGRAQNCTNKENRWDILLKRKDWLDEDCEIVDTEFGTGKYHDCVGSLLLRFPPNGVLFSAGSGLSDLQRIEYVANPPIGLTAKIKYEMLSEGGVPLKPTIECVND